MTRELDALFGDLPLTLSVQDVAQMFNLTKPGVYKWLRDGVIPGYKLGSTWFILRDELKTQLEAGSNHRRLDEEGTSVELPMS